MVLTVIGPMELRCSRSPVRVTSPTSRRSLGPAAAMRLGGAARSFWGRRAKMTNERYPDRGFRDDGPLEDRDTDRPHRSEADRSCGCRTA
jgi:hypothetical protein